MGLAQACFDLAIAHARRRRQFGRAIAEFQAIQFKLADMAMEIELARTMVLKAAWLRDEGRPYTREASMAKVFASKRPSARPIRPCRSTAGPASSKERRRPLLAPGEDQRDRGGHKRDQPPGHRPLLAGRRPAGRPATGPAVTGSPSVWSEAGAPAPLVPTHARPESEPFRASAAHNQALVEDLRQRLRRAQEGGPARSRERHQARGKLLVRERIARLLDPDTPFLEPLATRGRGHVRGRGAGGGHRHRGRLRLRADGAGRGQRRHRQGRHLLPLTVKKHLRAQEVALENHLPCVYLVDSGGAFLPLQAEVFPDREHFGRIFYNQARLSAQGIPQIAP